MYVFFQYISGNLSKINNLSLVHILQFFFVIPSIPCTCLTFIHTRWNGYGYCFSLDRKKTFGLICRPRESNLGHSQSRPACCATPFKNGIAIFCYFRGIIFSVDVVSSLFFTESKDDGHPSNQSSHLICFCGTRSFPEKTLRR